jgi:hypothetical protein
VDVSTFATLAKTEYTDTPPTPSAIAVGVVRLRAGKLVSLVGEGGRGSVQHLTLQGALRGLGVDAGITSLSTCEVAARPKDAPDDESDRLAATYNVTADETHRIDAYSMFRMDALPSGRLLVTGRIVNRHSPVPMLVIEVTLPTQERYADSLQVSCTKFKLESLHLLCWRPDGTMLVSWKASRRKGVHWLRQDGTLIQEAATNCEKEGAHEITAIGCCRYTNMWALGVSIASTGFVIVYNAENTRMSDFMVGCAPDQITFGPDGLLYITSAWGLRVRTRHCGGALGLHVPAFGMFSNDMVVTNTGDVLVSIADWRRPVSPRTVSQFFPALPFQPEQTPRPVVTLETGETFTAADSRLYTYCSGRLRVYI